MNPIYTRPPFEECILLLQLWRAAHDARFEKGHSEPSAEERAFEARWKELEAKWR